MKIKDVLANITRYTSDAVIITTMPENAKYWPVIQFVNDAFCALTAYRSEEVIGRDISLILADESAGKIKTSLKDIWACAARTDMEVCILTKNGQPRWIEFAASTVCNDHGMPSYLVITARDISDRKAMQEATEQQSLAFLYSETRLRAIMNSIADGVITVDEGGLVTSMSSVAERLFGIELADIEGKPVAELFAQDSIAELEALLAAKMYAKHDIGRLSSYELTARHHSGETFCARITCSIVRVGSQKTMVIAARDISQEKEALEALKMARDAAEITSKAKTEFLANMSHELRTPMNGILGLADLLREAPLSEEHREYLNALNGSAESLLTILNDILDFSKIEAGEMQVDQRPFSLRKVLEHVCDLMRSVATKKGILLSLDMPEDTEEWFLGDANRLQQVLMNLVGNAIKFTEKGSVCVIADVQTHSNGAAHVNVHVRDTGIGIPEHYITKLFNKFSQVDSTNTRKFGGTGLGLAICKQLIELMGGTISVKSVEGKGSCFSFLLNLPISSSQAAQKREVATMPTAYASKMTVLMVEDHAVNQMLLSRVLEKAGFHDVVIAKNGAEAVAACKEKDFDLVFMDCQMPVMDGYAATRAIREYEEETGRTRMPIVGITANVLSRDKEACFKAGMDAYLSKPFKLDRLNQTILTLLMPEMAESSGGGKVDLAPNA